MPNKSFQREIDLTDKQSLVVKNFNGPIELIACQGNTLHIEAKIFSNDQKEVDGTDVVVEETPDQVTVRGEPPGSKKSLRWRSRGESTRVEFLIKAPQWVPLMAKTLNGDIESLGFNCLGELKSMNGELEVERCSGRPILKLMNGRIVARSCAFAELKAKTMNGPLTVETTITPNSSYYLKSLHGEIELLIPQDSDAVIEAKCMQGEIDCQLPLKGLKKSGFKLSGTLGEGGAKVELKSMRGKITVAKSRRPNHSEPEEELISKMLKDGRITQDEASKLREAIT